MTLRQLDRQVLRSLTRAFQHGVESCYQQLFDTRCAKVLSFCRDLCFLPHLLEVSGSWKEVRVYDLANRCQLPSSIFTSYVNVDSLSTILADNMDFQHLCHALLQYRLQVKQNLFVSLTIGHMEYRWWGSSPPTRRHQVPKYSSSQQYRHRMSAGNTMDRSRSLCLTTTANWNTGSPLPG